EAEIEGRHQPAAVEQDALDAALDLFQGRVWPVRRRWFNHRDSGSVAYAAFFLALISLRLIRHSAIWIAFSAAPLRRLSDTHHSTRPFSTVASSRIRLM